MKLIACLSTRHCEESHSHQAHRKKLACLQASLNETATPTATYISCHTSLSAMLSLLTISGCRCLETIDWESHPSPLAAQAHAHRALSQRPCIALRRSSA